MAAASERNPFEAGKAIQQAEFLQSLLRRLVFDVNLVQQIACQLENLTVRMVYSSSVLDEETKRGFYRNLLYSDEEGK